MILLLDVGNTRLKWGLREGEQWLAQGAFAHDEAWDFDAVLPPPPLSYDVWHTGDPRYPRLNHFLPFVVKQNTGQYNQAVQAARDTYPIEDM